MWGVSRQQPSIQGGSHGSSTDLHSNRRWHLGDVVDKIDEHGYDATIIHDVVFESDEQRLQMLFGKILQKQSQRTTTWSLVYLHKSFCRSHIHIIHACQQQRCQCSLLHGLPRVRRNRNVCYKSVGQYNKTYYVNLIQYFLRKGTGQIHLQNSRTDTGQSYHRTFDIQDFDGSWCGEKGLVETQTEICANFNSNQTIGSSSTQFVEGNTAASSNRNERATRQYRIGGKVKQQILNYILMNPTSPISNVVETKMFNELYGLCDSKTINVCVKCAEKIINHMTYHEIQEYVHGESNYGVVKCVFDSVRSHFASTYYTVPEILYLVRKLLYVQYNNYQAMQEFVNALYAWCTFTAGKFNTIFLIGPKNCMKTKFASWICSSFLQCKKVTKVNRYTGNFAMQPFAEGNAILMDDPNLDDGAKQSLLALLSGDSITVDVKYEPPKQIRKLPVMICSNFDLFQGGLILQI